MMAIIGMFYQDGLTGSAWGDWSAFTDSPLRAFESELGVQPPVGFWDPLGFTADGDVAAFKRRRTVEIKHGRVSMLACMGYIAPEYIRFPGYLSPSTGLKFADLPNGLQATSKVSPVGWLQWVLFCGVWEFLWDGENAQGWWGFGETKGNPGEYGWKALSAKDEAGRTRKLNAEIANGRFYQDGLTGSAWGDWSAFTDSPLRAFENELGVQAPVGYWDPMGLAKDGNADEFRRRREVELKHGRVSMWAAVGYIVPEYLRWPGYCSPSEGLKFADIPNGLGALSKLSGNGLLQIFLFCGFLETNYFKQDPNRGAGDFENAGVLGVPGRRGTMAEGDAKKKRLNAELANGRLAMMAIMGMFFQDGLTGSAWGDWSLYTASPLRAFESELGVQAPAGFWDPAGYCDDGDQEGFLMRRKAEIKHGRVCMWACMGYMVPEYFKWPGYLSPSQNLAFADIPNGLKAISKVPNLGWIQIFFFAGLLETCWFEEDPSRAPGDFKRGGILGFPNGSTMKEGALKTRKLNVELANGRLAMMAFVGMVFQDGLTGSAWGDWALYTASPLRDGMSPSSWAAGAMVSTGSGAASAAPIVIPDREVGALAPLGYWDPAGLSKGISDEEFRKFRQAELKHGRIAMLANVGLLIQAMGVRFDGFKSVPAGIEAG